MSYEFWLIIAVSLVLGAAHRHNYNVGYRDGTRDGRRAGEADGWEKGKAFGEYEAKRKAEGGAAMARIMSWHDPSRDTVAELRAMLERSETKRK